MQQSPWQLESIVFPKLHITAKSDYDQDVATDNIPELSARAYSLNGSDLIVEMNISSNKQAKNLPYQFELSAFGEFKNDNARDLSKLTQLQVQQMLETAAEFAMNAAQIMYGAAREYLATVSARAPWGPIFLSTILIDREDVPLAISPELNEKANATADGSSRKIAKRA